MSVTREHVDGGIALRFERRLAYPVERVWRAVTEPAELERWFPASVAWGPKLGERFEAYGQSGEITRLEPQRLIEWTYGADRYSFELRADGDSCVLVFVHVLADSSQQDDYAAGWEIYFTRLDVHLGGGYLSEEDAHAQARPAG